MVNAQKWLEQNFPKKQRWHIEELDLSNQNLEGDLDLATDFHSLEVVDISGNPQLGKIINNNECTFTIKIKAQDWLNWKYPDKKAVKEIKENGEQKIEGELIIDNFPQLEEIKLKFENLIKFQINNCPQLNKLDCSKNEIISLEVANCPKLEIIDGSSNRLVKLNLMDCPNLKEFDCWNNLLTGLDLSQNKELEVLDISDNNFFEQDLSFLSHLVNLKKLKIGNFIDRDWKRNWKERIKREGIYNRFIGSLKPLQNLNKLKKLDISNTDLDSGLEYLPRNLDKIFHYTQTRPTSKVKEIAWYLLLSNKKEQKNWKELGFTLEETKTWMEVGLVADDYGFADYLKNKKNLSPEGIKTKQLLEEQAFKKYSENDEFFFEFDANLGKNDELTKLRNEYNCLFWKDIHSDFTPRLKKEWEEKGFGHEQTEKWVRNNSRLKPEESNLAKYLQDKEIAPWEAGNYSNIDKLREEYEERTNSENEKKSYLAINVKEIDNWENIHSDFKEIQQHNYQKQWESFGFDYQQTEAWINKGIKPSDSEFAAYLKAKGYQPSQLLISDLIKIRKEEYHNLPNWLDFWYPAEKRREATKLDLRHKKLKGDLVIDSWENLEELDCSVNDFTTIGLNNLSKLKTFIAWDCDTQNLTITNCHNLQKINTNDNCLNSLDFLHSCNPESLIYLNVANNNIGQDLSPLSKFKNLKRIYLGYVGMMVDWGGRFHGSLKYLQNLTQLKQLDISATDVDQGLEYLPDSLEVICCSYWNERLFGCNKIIEELQDYRLRSYRYSPWVWKENQPSFKALVEKFNKTNPNLDVRDYLQRQGVFFNVRTGTFEGNFQFLTSSLETKGLLKKKIKEVLLLESQVQELTNFIKNQKEKIVQAYLYFAPEQELLKKLVKAHLEFTTAQKRKLPFKQQRREKETIYQELEDKLNNEELMGKVEDVFTDCDKLAEAELELEARTNGQIALEFTKEDNLSIIYNCFNFGDINNEKGHVLIGNQIGDNADLSCSNRLIEFSQPEQTHSLSTNPGKQAKEQWQVQANYSAANNWQNLHPSFTSQLIQTWANHHFTPQQAQEWIDINPLSQQNQATQEPAFYAWLRDTKNLTPEQVLNHGHLNSLKQEYQTNQQAYIQQANLPPK